MLEERYEPIFFVNDQLNQVYFALHLIYVPDYTNKPMLNHFNSRELQGLIEKIIAKWNKERCGLINYLITYPEIIRASGDLYSYLFKHLL